MAAGLIGADEAVALLAQAGTRPSGVVVTAWQWTDHNGRNVLVAALDSRDHARSIRVNVTQVARLGQQPEVLRTVRDQGARCRRNTMMTAAVTAGSIAVTDLDQNGIAEVSIGWTHQCLGSDRRQARLALLSGGKKYILRSDGPVGSGASGLRTDPQPSQWPQPFLASLTALFAHLAV